MAGVIESVRSACGGFYTRRPSTIVRDQISWTESFGLWFRRKLCPTCRTPLADLEWYDISELGWQEGIDGQVWGRTKRVRHLYCCRNCRSGVTLLDLWYGPRPPAGYVAYKSMDTDVRRLSRHTDVRVTRRCENWTRSRAWVEWSFHHEAGALNRADLVRLMNTCAWTDVQVIETEDGRLRLENGAYDGIVTFHDELSFTIFLSSEN